jgi:hypothetical protein
MVFKKGGRLNGADRRRMNGQNIEVVVKFNYLGVTLESTGCWNQQKTLAKATEYQSLVAIEKCILVTPSRMIQMLANIWDGI